jgi:hypothetical protein
MAVMASGGPLPAGRSPGGGTLAISPDDHPIDALLGPGLLRIGKHPRYGVAAVGLVFGEVTVLATYEMGSCGSCRGS